MIIEIVLLLMLTAVCFYATYTDITCGLIYNRVLIPLLVVGIGLDIVYYWQIYPDGVGTFLLNMAFTAGFSLILYMLHIWAAGDSKLLILVSILIPVRTTLNSARQYCPEVLIIAIAFAASFVYLAYDSIRMWRKRGLNREKIAKSFRQYLMRLAMSCVYIMTLCKMESAILTRMGIDNVLISLVLNLCILLILSGIRSVWKPSVCIPVLIISIGYSLITGIWMMNQRRAIYYLATAVVMLMQLIINEFNYDSVPTEEVHKGMVLSRGSIMVMSMSKVRGLPTYSTEDLRSRITEDEAAAVKRWGKTKGSSGTVQIVRKMPFAIFISIGVMAYYLLIIWG